MLACVKQGHTQAATPSVRFKVWSAIWCFYNGRKCVVGVRGLHNNDTYIFCPLPWINTFYSLWNRIRNIFLAPFVNRQSGRTLFIGLFGCQCRCLGFNICPVWYEFGSRSGSLQYVYFCQEFNIILFLSGVKTFFLGLECGTEILWWFSTAILTCRSSNDLPGLSKCIIAFWLSVYSHHCHSI